MLGPVCGSGIFLSVAVLSLASLMAVTQMSTVEASQQLAAGVARIHAAAVGRALAASGVNAARELVIADGQVAARLELLEEARRLEALQRQLLRGLQFGDASLGLTPLAEGTAAVGAFFNGSPGASTSPCDGGNGSCSGSGSGSGVDEGQPCLSDAAPIGSLLDEFWTNIGDVAGVNWGNASSSVARTLSSVRDVTSLRRAWDLQEGLLGERLRRGQEAVVAAEASLALELGRRAAAARVAEGIVLLVLAAVGLWCLEERATAHQRRMRAAKRLVKQAV